MKAVKWIKGLFALAALPAGAGSPTAVERANEAIETGVEYLLKSQSADGSWGYHAQQNPYAIYAPVPGAHRPAPRSGTYMVVQAPGRPHCPTRAGGSAARPPRPPPGLEARADARSNIKCKTR